MALEKLAAATLVTPKADARRARVDDEMHSDVMLTSEATKHPPDPRAPGGSSSLALLGMTCLAGRQLIAGASCLLLLACAQRRIETASSLASAASTRAAALVAAVPAPAPADGLPPIVHAGEHVPIARLASDGTGATIVLGELRGRTVAFVADEDDRAVHVVDLDRGEDVGRAPLGSRPSQLAITRDGKLLVALRDANAVATLEASVGGPLETTGRWTVGTEPMALAVTPDDGTVVVANGWGHTVEAIDRGMGERTFEVDVAREPRAVLVSADGTKAYVGHDAASVLTVVDLSAGTAKAIDLTRKAFHYAVDPCGPSDPRTTYEAAVPTRAARGAYAIGRLPPSPGRHEAWDVTGHERLLVNAARVAPGPIDRPTGGYGQEARTILFDADVVDGQGDAIVSTGGLEPLDLRGEATASCLLPRAVIVDPKGRSELVACMGSDEVIEIRIGFASLEGVANRWKVARGPVGLATDREGERLVVWSALDRKVTLQDRRSTHAAAVALAPPANPAPEDVLRGRSLFHTNGDPRIARDGRACASCHPDGRDDGLVWSAPDGPRRTRLLVGRVAGGPYGWRAEHATLEEHVAASVARLGGTGLPPEDARALAAYLRALPPPPRVAASDEEGARIKRGRAIFEAPETACTSCHDPAEGGSDRMVHDVLSRATGDRFGDFRTPPLLGVAGAAPYFHDGRYATLDALLDHADGRMGNASGLPPDDRAALVAYLRSL